MYFLRTNNDARATLRVTSFMRAHHTQGALWITAEQHNRSTPYTPPIFSSASSRGTLPSQIHFRCLYFIVRVVSLFLCRACVVIVHSVLPLTVASTCLPYFYPSRYTHTHTHIWMKQQTHTSGLRISLWTHTYSICTFHNNATIQHIVVTIYTYVYVQVYVCGYLVLLHMTWWQNPKSRTFHGQTSSENGSVQK